VLLLLPSILLGKALDDYTDEEAHAVMSVNFTAQALLIKRLLPHFAERAQLIMLASVSGQRGSFDPIYAASKGAVLAFVKALAQAYAPRLRALAVAPTLIADSRMYEDMSPERRAYHVEQSPMKRLLTAKELAGILTDLTKDHWAHLNGCCVDVNGGQYVR
jgi:3-oxoacyl-[acyl-carrier protein] reductase